MSRGNGFKEGLIRFTKYLVIYLAGYLGARASMDIAKKILNR